MKKKNGFVASGLLYALLILFLAFIIGLLTLLSNRKQILDKLKKDIKDDLYDSKSFDIYEIGEVIYYNPVTDKLCGDYVEENSKTGVKTGCLKWYVINDASTSNVFKIMLDHNTTATSVYSTVETDLRGLVDTSKWVNKPTIISAEEVNKIIGAQDIDLETPNLEAIYFDSKEVTASPTCKLSDTSTCQYGWLYDRTRTDSKNYGAYNNSDVETYGYWTDTLYEGVPNNYWVVSGMGAYGVIGENTPNVGVRPVITLDKEEINNKITKTLEYNYKGTVQQFTAFKSGYYQIDAWGAQGGSTSSSAIGGKGAYTSGIIYLEKGETLYIYVGGEGLSSSAGVSGVVLGGYNGGGITSGQDCCNRKFGTGGGATDIRLDGGNMAYNESKASRIMVAAGGGGAFEGGNVGTIYSNGGYGGALVGGNGTQNSDPENQYCYGEGGTQTSGGKVTTNCTKNSSQGSVTGSFSSGGGYPGASTGGGSGYYGGSRSGHIASAGGGSSYVSGFLGAVAIQSSSNITPKVGCTDGTKDITCSYHYSGKIFVNAIMLAGNQPMPTHDLTSTMTGNSGNGYARVTYVDQVKYNYTGAAQAFRSPESGVYKIELWGAQGDEYNGYTGGKGAYTSGKIRLPKDKQLYIYVGSKPLSKNQGGYNGGISVPDSTNSNNGDDMSRYGRPGGGATDIRTVGGSWNLFDSLKTRIMVAAGGSGAGDRNTISGVTNYYGAGNGAAGGELKGIDGESINYGTASNTYGFHGYGTGGTQTSGGIRYDENFAKTQKTVVSTGTGSFGGVKFDNSAQSGAGGGYYSGGNGAHGSGGGGSSFISGHTGCDAILESSTESNIVHSGQPNHFSGLIFGETQMIAGNKAMPTHDGKGNMTGNSLDGFAKITYCGINGSSC